MYSPTAAGAVGLFHGRALGRAAIWPGTIRFLCMTNPFYPHLFGAVVIVLLWLVALLLTWGLNHQWWTLKAVRKLKWWVPAVGLVADALWAIGTAADARWLTMIGAGATSSTLILEVALLIALPFSGLVLVGERIARWFGARRAKSANASHASDAPEGAESPAALPGVGQEVMPAVIMSEPAAPAEPLLSGAAAQAGAVVAGGGLASRRSFLTRSAAVIPAAALSAAGYGLARSWGAVVMPEIPLTIAGLHPALDGLRILHLSDLHLGYFADLHDLEALVRNAEGVRADMVIASGDIADDNRMLPDALRMIAALKPRLGVFATLGNHEYFHDIAQVLRIIERGPIPLLRNTGAEVRVGEAVMYVGGADDPVKLGAKQWNHQFLLRSVTEAFDGAPSEAFHLLVSHRPEGFDIAREQGLQLTISGHTHGGQLGFNGRSMLEPFMRDRYMWGHYQQGASQLYTSAGVGHWFPFRLGCPPEAPVYVLRRG